MMLLPGAAAPEPLRGTPGCCPGIKGSVAWGCGLGILLRYVVTGVGGLGNTTRGGGRRGGTTAKRRAHTVTRSGHELHIL
jgi:hypothetical protein